MRSRRSFFPQWKTGESLPLPFNDEPPASHAPLPKPVNATNDASKSLPVRGVRQALWLSVFFPRLLFESHTSVSERLVGAAVIGESRGQRVVLACSEAATAAGIQSGMSLSAAIALVPELELHECLQELNHLALRALAEQAQAYTSMVVLEPPSALLLEIGSSLNLFGGIDALLTKVQEHFHACDYSAQLAVASTPAAAFYLSRWQPGQQVVVHSELAQALRLMPLSVLDWPPEVLRRFHSIGVQTLGDCRRLPRAGFARRFGAARLLALDRLYGQYPDPRQAYQAADRFLAELELSAEIDNTDILYEACRLLFTRLSRFLKRRQLSAGEVHIRFYALHAPASELVLRPACVGQGSEHWLELLRIRLERWQMPAPAVVVELSCERFQAQSTETTPLAFSAQDLQHDQQTAGALLIERLQARLGQQAVQALACVADLRPEFAMQAVQPGQAHYHCAANSPWHEFLHFPGLRVAPELTQKTYLQRPLWLLEQPKPLGSRLSSQQWRIVSGPERIETGWWDGKDTRRDYYVARMHSGVWAWLFRERRPDARCWFLHGYFA